jgi:integrase/recombinase XerD
MINIDKLKFLEWLEAKGLSERTKKEYLFYLGRCPYQTLSQSDINLFLNIYKDNNVARSFLKNLFLFIKTCGMFNKEVKLQASELELIIPKRTGRKKSRIPNYLTYEEIIKLANNMQNPRNRIMVLLNFTTGLRLSEFINLKFKDFNFKEWLNEPKETGKLRFIGKGNKEAILSIEPEIMVGIIQYINETDGRGKDEFVFRSTKTNRLSKSAWAKILRVEGKRILGKPVNPHELRHSYATFLLNNGLNVMEVKELLRHESLNSTQIYLHIDNEELKKKYLNKLESH